MRHFTPENTDWMHFEPQAAHPAPFHGAWPTRILWVFSAYERNDELSLGSDPPKRVFYERYFGKPTIDAVNRLSKLARRFPTNRFWLKVRIKEIDRRNILVKQSMWTQMGGAIRSEFGLLWSAYHPWQSQGLWLDHFRAKSVVKRIGGFSVYSPLAKLSLDYIAAFKGWMKLNCGETLMSPEEKAAAKSRAVRDKRLGRLRAQQIARQREATPAYHDHVHRISTSNDDLLILENF